MIKKTRIFWTIAITVLVTAALGFIAVNLTTGEKQLDQQVPRLYASPDPQYKRAMGSLLGPGIVGGNRVQALINGEQIFPAMLQAIRSAEPATTAMPTNGATRATASTARPWRRCRPFSWTTGSRKLARSCTAKPTFPRNCKRANQMRRFFRAHLRAAARACN